MLAAVAGLGFAAVNLPGFARFRSALGRPAETQRRRLRAYLERNRDTAFGREHGFARLRSYEDFAAAVPPRSYDELEPWVLRAARGEPRVLSADEVLRLEPTSGSTRAAKWIPYTAGLQGELRRAVAPWLCDLVRREPGVALGRAYWSISPSAGFAPPPPEGTVVPVGFEDDTAYLGGLAQRLAAATLAVPSTVRHVADVESFRYVTLLFLLHARDLALVSVWHPSFLTLLLEALPRHFERLVADLRAGTLGPPGPLPASVAAPLQARLRPAPGRASEIARAGPLDVAAIWPRLRVVSAWAEAHAALPAAQLRRRLGPRVRLEPKGLLATEACVSIPWGERRVLAVRSHLFELEQADGRLVPADGAEDGGEYAVVVTTAGGLWRYRMHDRVRVRGFAGRTPALEFLGKQDHVCDRRGEKLHEAFVAAALGPPLAAAGARFALLAPEEDGRGCGYTLFVELEQPPGPPAGLAREAEAALCANPHYAHARQLGQLRALGIFVVARGGEEAWLRRATAEGRRAGDVKPLLLSPRDDWASVFDGRRPG